MLQFFKLYVVDENGILNETKLVAAIKDIADRSCTQGKPVGILTGNDRDTWAKDCSLLLGLFQFFKIKLFGFTHCNIIYLHNVGLYLLHFF